MSENSKIEWTDHTFNPWEGCQKVGPGCDNCYAETRNKRFGGGVAVNWGPGALRRRTSASNWRKPIEWNKAHDAFFAEHGRRQRVFCASLADVFDNEAPDEWRQDLFALISATPNLDWLVLTKRIGNVRKMVPATWLATGGWPKHVRLGITICNQAEADRDVAKLIELHCPNLLSIEPLLSAINLRSLPWGEGEFDSLKPDLWAEEVENWRDTSETWEEDFEDWYGVPLADAEGPMHARIDWVIVGGESGHQARPMHPDWARSLRDQCAAAGVPFLFKQWGEWAPTWFEAHRHLGPAGMPPDPAGMHSLAGTRLIVGEYRDGRKYEELWPVVKVGKKAAGRLLDGVQHDGYPITAKGTQP